MDVITKEKLISRAGDLKVLPFVARKMLDTIGREMVSISDLGEIIEKDQTISARILKISNSPFYGLRQEVTSINQAILILGLRTIRSLVLSVSTRAIYKKFGITEQKIWEHSVGAAIAAKIISAEFGDELVEVAFTGGLMHDLGKVVMNNETPEAFAEVMMRTYNEDLDSISAETDVYGYDHSEIGAKVAEKWGLSNVLVEIIKKHHLDKYTLADVSESLVAKSIACVHLADNICKVLGIGYRESDDSIALDKLPSAVYLGIGVDKIGPLVKEIEKAYQNEKSAFQ